METNANAETNADADEPATRCGRRCAPTRRSRSRRGRRRGSRWPPGAGLVLWRTSPVDQGFYFTFISFGILLQLCDFGLSYASLQAASHLQAIGRRVELPSLAVRAAAINGVVTVVAASMVATLGWSAFAAADAAAPGRMATWAAPWIAFIVVVAANQWTAPFVFVIEGGVSVGRAWRFKLGQEVVSGIALVAVLALGHGLWALVAYYAARSTTAAGWTFDVLRRRVDPAGSVDPGATAAGSALSSRPPRRRCAGVPTCGRSSGAWASARSAAT